MNFEKILSMDASSNVTFPTLNYNTIYVNMVVPANSGGVRFERSDDLSTWIDLSLTKINSDTLNSDISFNESDIYVSNIYFNYIRFIVKSPNGNKNGLISIILRDAVNYLNPNSVSSGSGNSDNKTQRVVIANDQSALLVKPTSLGIFGDNVVSCLTPEFQHGFTYNVDPRVIDISKNTGFVDFSNNHLRVLSPVATIGSCSANTIPRLHYKNGQGGIMRTALFLNSRGSDGDGYSCWGFGTADVSSNLYPTSGFGFYATDEEFGVWLNWDSSGPFDYSSNSFNGESVSIDPTLGNVYQLRFSWLGYGRLEWYILDPTDNDFKLVHVLQKTNTNSPWPTGMSIFKFNNLSSVYFNQITTGSGITDSAFEMNISSLALFNEGVSRITYPTRSFDFSQNASSPGSFLFSIKNVTTFNGEPNFNRLFITSMTASANDVQQNRSTFLIFKGTPTGTSYFDIETNVSIIQWSIAGSYTTSRSELLYSLPLGRDSALLGKPNPPGIIVYPGEEIIVYYRASNINAQIGVTLEFQEDL